MGRRSARFAPLVSDVLESRTLLSRPGLGLSGLAALVRSQATRATSTFPPDVTTKTPAQQGRLLSVQHNGAQAKITASTATKRKVVVGALGDSYTDEYQFYSPYRSRARNWVEILAQTGRASFGPLSSRSRGEPRNQGYAYNWARSGDVSSGVVANQLPGLASQVASGKVQYAWLYTGGNDYLYYLIGVAANVTPADQAEQQLKAVETQLSANFSTAVNTLLAANPNAKIVVATLPNVARVPLFKQSTSPVVQAMLDATVRSISRYNDLIRATAAGNGRVALVDLANLTSELSQSAGAIVQYGGTWITAAIPGQSYHNFFLDDGVHVGTVGQGMIASSFINAIDTKFGAKVAHLTPRKIVQFASSVRPERIKISSTS